MSYLNDGVHIESPLPHSSTASAGSEIGSFNYSSGDYNSGGAYTPFFPDPAFNGSYPGNGWLSGSLEACTMSYDMTAPTPSQDPNFLSNSDVVALEEFLQWAEGAPPQAFDSHDLFIGSSQTFPVYAPSPSVNGTEQQCINDITASTVAPIAPEPSHEAPTPTVPPIPSKLYTWRKVNGNVFFTCTYPGCLDEYAFRTWRNYTRHLSSVHGGSEHFAIKDDKLRIEDAIALNSPYCTMQEYKCKATPEECWFREKSNRIFEVRMWGRTDEVKKLHMKKYHCAEGKHAVPNPEEEQSDPDYGKSSNFYPWKDLDPACEDANGKPIRSHGQRSGTMRYGRNRRKHRLAIAVQPASAKAIVAQVPVQMNLYPPLLPAHSPPPSSSGHPKGKRKRENETPTTDPNDNGSPPRKRAKRVVYSTTLIPS